MNPLLQNVALGSKVVISMIQKLLRMVEPHFLQFFRLYFDNFFTLPDLLLHLKKFGLSATGTVRRDRAKTDTKLPDKSTRGTLKCFFEESTKINCVTVMDSKPVSILSTAHGIFPKRPLQRF